MVHLRRPIPITTVPDPMSHLQALAKVRDEMDVNDAGVFEDIEDAVLIEIWTFLLVCGECLVPLLLGDG